MDFVYKDMFKAGSVLALSFSPTLDTVTTIHWSVEKDTATSRIDAMIVMLAIPVQYMPAMFSGHLRNEFTLL